MFRLFCFFFFCSFLSLSPLRAQYYHFDCLRVEEGLTHPTVNDLYQDEFSRTWIATGDGLNCYDGNQVKCFRTEMQLGNPLSDTDVRMVSGDGQGNLYLKTGHRLLRFDLRSQQFETIWEKPLAAFCLNDRKEVVFNSEGNLFTYDPVTRQVSPFFRRDPQVTVRARSMLWTRSGCLWIAAVDGGIQTFTEQGPGEHLFRHDEVRRMMQDTNSDIWIATSASGIFCYSERQGTVIRRFEPAFDQIRALAIDRQGSLWFGSRKGLGRLELKSNTVEYIPVGQKLSNASVTSLMTDDQGVLWIGTYFGGVNYTDLSFTNMRYYPSLNPRLPYPVMGSMAQDESGHLWIGTEGGGLARLSPDNLEVSHCFYPGGDLPLSTSHIKQVVYDRYAKKIRVGGDFSDVIHSIDPGSNRIENFRLTNGSQGRVNAVFGIVCDSLYLYVATNTGVFRIRKNDEVQELLYAGEIFNHASNDLLLDREGNLWFHADNHCLVYAVSGKLRKKIAFPKSVNFFFQDSAGRIWVGSSDHELFLLDESRDAFISQPICREDRTGGILAMEELSTGELLLGTTRGMLVFHPEQQKISVPLPGRDLPVSMINRHSLLRTSQNRLFVGGTAGLISFAEREIFSDYPTPQIHLSELFIHNRREEVYGDGRPLSEGMPFARKVTLRHDQNHFSFGYYLSTLTRTAGYETEYRLKGAGDEWMPNRFGNIISFTNIDPGSYLFQIRLKNNPASLRELAVQISPPFYATWWAVLLYVLCGTGVTLWVLKLYRTRFYLQTSLDFEKKNKLRLEEMNESKIRFFTNISHEIRTPITLIIGQVEMLLQPENSGGDASVAVNQKLKKIYQSATGLKKLVNELLDFRKQELGLMRHRFAQQDMAAFLQTHFSQFTDYARQQEVCYRLEGDLEPVMLWFDEVQMSKVLNNVIANAFKFTPAGGNITISLKADETHACIRIADSGPGIPDKEKQLVFERFYQTETGLSRTGSGIGLALTKGIVDNHRGTISVADGSGGGAVFEIRLKRGSEHLDSDNLFIKEPPEEEVAVVRASCPGDAPDEPEEQNRQPLVLIVEDNEEIRGMVREILLADYRVETAGDGAEGYQKTLLLQPDLVITDVMMPKMSGTQLCEKIKGTLETSHIPVVMLTAKTSLENEMEGLRAGADSYIAKPFHTGHLLVQCDNLLHLRQVLRKKYLCHPDTENELPVSESLDTAFLKKAVAVVEEHLADGDFDVERFSREMLVGRTTLFTKIKGITGETPNHFIQSIRLKKAAFRLLHEPEMNVSEIGYSVGFNEPRYFYRCFKEKFGHAPMSYRKMNIPAENL